MSAVGLVASGAAGLEIVLTTFLLNVRHVLYGLSLGRTATIDGWRRPVAAYFLTDEAFGVVAARRERTFGFLLGAELSLFVTWNLATLGGGAARLGDPRPDGDRCRPRLPARLPRAARAARAHTRRARRRRRRRRGCVGHGASAPGGIPILVAGVGGSLLGAVLTRKMPPDAELRLDDAAREVA